MNRGTDRQPQIDAVASALLAGEPVDQIAAIRRGWGLRLSSLIHRLRCRGWPVVCERDHGSGLGRYRLPPGWKPPAASIYQPELMHANENRHKV